MDKHTSAAGDLRIAVVGMGYWGRNLVRNFFQLGTLDTICDEDASCRIGASDYSGVRFATDFDDVAADPSIQAVVISTPAAAHYEMAFKALANRKNVFVEKPLALKVDEGKRLVELARENGCILMVGHILLYHPAVVRMKELIRAGELGEIRYFYSNRLNIGRIRKEENILWSFAPHDISVMLNLIREDPVEIDCRGSAYINSDVVDVTMSQFLFPSGISGHIFVSWLHPFKEQRLVVVGSRKMAVFDDMAEDKLVVYPHKIEWKNQIPTVVKAGAESVRIDSVEPLRAECLHFLHCIRNRETPVSDGQEGLRVLRILDQCQNSLSRHRNVGISRLSKDPADEQV
ncbi:Gfo/Idh/MocA family oxidoreductase [bacterium]|nr:Gfo/Idh/MocA family oxidoreductase [candidate division CSSED10-310 bacterium]